MAGTGGTISSPSRRSFELYTFLVDFGVGSLDMDAVCPGRNMLEALGARRD